MAKSQRYDVGGSDLAAVDDFELDPYAVFESAFEELSLTGEGLLAQRTSSPTLPSATERVVGKALMEHLVQRL